MGFPSHRRFVLGQRNVGAALAERQGFAGFGEETEGRILTVAGPGDGDDLAAAGIVAGAAGSKVGDLVDVVHGDIGEHVA